MRRCPHEVDPLGRGQVTFGHPPAPEVEALGEVAERVDQDVDLLAGGMRVLQRCEVRRRRKALLEPAVAGLSSGGRILRVMSRPDYVSACRSVPPSPVALRRNTVASPRKPGACRTLAAEAVFGTPRFSPVFPP